MPACPAFQQSKSPNDISHVARLALRLNTSIRCPSRTTRLSFSQAKQPKQWSLPQHLFDPCQADSWPLPAEVPYHPDSCLVTALSKKKKRKINSFFLPWCDAEKTKKVTKDGPLHGQV
ncbi:hypothetical protein ACFX1W_035089 [Malus domestica]